MKFLMLENISYQTLTGTKIMDDHHTTTYSPAYTVITHSPLPQNNFHLPLPFFGGNYPNFLLDNIY